MAPGWHHPARLMPFLRLSCGGPPTVVVRGLPNEGDRVFKLQTPHQAIDRESRTDRRAPRSMPTPSTACPIQILRSRA